MKTEQLRELLAAMTPGPWAWEAEDTSLLSLQGPMYEDNHVLSAHACKSCSEKPIEGAPSHCLWPNAADAAGILAFVNHAAALLDVVEAAKEYPGCKFPHQVQDDRFEPIYTEVCGNCSGCRTHQALARLEEVDG